MYQGINNTVSTVEKGKQQEDIAWKYLENAGVRIIEQNFRCRQGEIDLVGLHEGCLVFFEVKYRTGRRSGLPEEAVGEAKQRKICRASDYYRIKHPESNTMQVRYDVIAIAGKEIRWYQNAFFYRQGRYGSGW